MAARHVEEGLRQMVGQSGLVMISSLLEPVGLAATGPRKLHEVLVSVFKEEGALIIEREIARRLLGKIGQRPTRS